MLLTEENIGQTFKDYHGNSFTIIKEFKTCCSPLMYHAKEEGTNNVYAYSQFGQRLDYNGSPVQDKDTSLILY